MVFHDPQSFVHSIQKPRVIIMLVKAGAPVDQTIKTLSVYMEKGDCIIDGGNDGIRILRGDRNKWLNCACYILEWECLVAKRVLRHGPSVMHGGSFEPYNEGGSGNFVKMVHNGIEYGDMQLIAQAYDVRKCVGKLSNDELQQVFSDWNEGELLSFLIEITADIFGIKDDKGSVYLVDKVLDKTGMKGTGKWTVQQAAELSIAAPTIASSLDSRFLSGLKEERIQAATVFKSNGVVDIISEQAVDKQKLIDDGECIIRAVVLDCIKKAYDRNPDLPKFLVDPEFAKEIIDQQFARRRVVCLAINSGISTPVMSSSLAYFDTYRRERLPANLVQAQRDYFGAHTYEGIDMLGSFHTEWLKLAKLSKM
ncbi:UNVERIFIED_CONTAM: 6-phosphogluconate dehydrogenase, decarboxylating 1 [Sesamum radiatum]|uniref:phosphogluconate dehydrogenase (NADP(+)-dependent, decarboxylating) n=1 Tax=Sesamum radiatum TaxID=300843 RepID=A0AAW2TUZ5_SESRA